jgi:LacI family transcriptional regulator
MRVKSIPALPVPTISEVAAAAGVSRATVSRAFTRPGMLNAETVARVLAVAQRIGYVPNQAARGLSTGRHGRIGLIVPDVTNPFFPPLIRAAQLHAEESDLSLFLGNSDEDVDREERLLARFAGQVEGLVLVSSRLPDARIRTHAARQPLVLVNRDVAGLPRVLIDTALGMTTAVAHLADLCHREIAWIAGPATSWSSAQREAAVMAEAARRGLRVHAVPPARRPSFEAGRDAVPFILDAGATAVIAFDDVTAQGVMAGLAECGVTVPQAMSVVGCDDVTAARTVPALTTVSSRGDEAGRLAVELLRTCSGEDVRRTLDTELVVRATTARRDHAATPPEQDPGSRPPVRARDQAR